MRIQIRMHLTNEKRVPHWQLAIPHVTCSDVRIFHSPQVVYTHKVQEVWNIMAHPSLHWWHRYYVCTYVCKGLHLTLHIKARGCSHWHKPFKCGWSDRVFGRGGQTPQLSLPKTVAQLIRVPIPSNSILPSPLKGNTLFYQTFLLYALFEPSPNQTQVIGTQPCVGPCQRGVSVCCKDGVDAGSANYVLG